MVRSRSSSSSSWFRYVNPAYYLKRPKRLALLFIFFVFGSLLVWDRQTLVREHEVIYLFSALPFVILTYLCLFSTPMTFAIVFLLKANGSNLNVEHCFLFDFSNTFGILLKITRFQKRSFMRAVSRPPSRNH